jgi:hypothetical protein
MIFDPDKALVIPTFVMGRQNVKGVSTFNYLGVLFSEKCDWDIHPDSVLQRIKKAFGAWCPLFACNKRPVPVRSMMFCGLVFSAVT